LDELNFVALSSEAATAPSSKAVSSAVNPAAAPATAGGCDDFCQN